MSTQNGQNADETVFNAAYVSKIDNEAIVGKLDLNNPDPDNGGNVTNVQKVVNENASGLVAALLRLDSLEGVETPLTNFTALVDPTETNDSTEGYEVGSFWINTATDKFFVAFDVSEGAAIWDEAGGGTGGAGDADTIHLITADNLNDVIDIDLTGNDAAFDGGGTLDGTLSLSTLDADLITGETVIKYVAGATSENDYFGFSKAVPRGPRGRDLGLTFEYKTDSTTVDDDFRFCVKQKDGTKADYINYFDLKAFYNVNGTSSRFPTDAFIASNCTEIELGFQNTSTATTVELLVDNILISSDPFTYKDLLDTQEFHHSSASSTLLARASGAAIRFEAGELTSSGMGILTYDETTGRFASLRKGSGTFALNASLASQPNNFSLYKNGSEYFQGGDGPNFSNGEVSISVTVNFEANDYFHFQTSSSLSNGSDIVFVVVQATATSEHVITPAKSEKVNQFNEKWDFTSGSAVFTSSKTGSSVLTFTKTATGDYTATIDAGLLTVAPELQMTAEYTGGAVVTPSVVGTVSSTTFRFRSFDTGGTARDSIVNFSITKQSPDFDNNANFLAAIPRTKVAVISDVKASGATGGTFTSGSWITRDLNTVEGDSDLVNLSSNQITLRSGRYAIEALAPAYNVENHVIKLRDVTNGLDLIMGTSSFDESGSGLNSGSISHLSGVVNFSAATILEIQHRCSATQATSGLGRSTSFGVNEVFSRVTITKLK